jgi:imidazolonepropionase-like amidohydrolase
MSVTAFVNARLIDGTGAAPVDASTVVVDSGRIVYTGRSEGAQVVEGARIVDLAGHTIVPGLIDCHVHFVVESTRDLLGRSLTTRASLAVFERAERMRRTLTAGVTTARDLGGIDAGYKQAVESGLISGPRLHVAIRLLSHTGGHADFTLPSDVNVTDLVVPVGEVIDDVRDARIATRRLIAAGADVIKVCATGGFTSPSDSPEDEGLTIEEIAAIVDEASRHGGRPVAAHAQGASGIRNAIRGGVTSIEHGYLIDDEGIDLMLEHGTVLVPTLSALNAPLPPDADPATKSARADVVDRARANLATALSRGVAVAMGTDASIGAHGDNLRELGHLVRLGLSPMQALVAGTASASRLLGIADEVGTVEVGKLADLVVCTVDPLGNIDALAESSSIGLVVQGGRIVKNDLPAT